MNANDLPFLPVTDLAALFKRREVSPTEVLNACLQRISQFNPKINAFTLIDEAGALRDAKEIEARWQKGETRGPLDGVPFTVKDNLMVSGYPFRRGSLVTPKKPVTEDAPIVQRCREAGAVFVGLTTMPEFGVGPVTISPLSGVTRNPWDTSKQSGGSSGGAAAGLAAGFCNFALGSDAGGSIRIPAALTGVVGLKPSGSRVPIYPASAAGSLSCNGPLTRTVADSALLLSYAARPDPRDGVTTLADGRDYTTGLNDGIKGLKAASSTTLGYAPLLDPEIEAAFQRAVKVFDSLGAEVTAEDPVIEDPIATYLTLLRAGYQFSLRNIAQADRELLSPPIREILHDTKPVTLTEYLQALEECQVFARRFHAFHARYDVLLTPTVAAPAFVAERHYPEEYEKFSNRRAWTPFTAIFNLTQQPAISVPIGLTSKGLPVGLQIVGARGAEATILRAAAAFEKANGFSQRPPLKP
jgi:aspartyl-tRNA(Asn)/glutamyl-tRNA(Gln) amidotransferase subunit A